VEEVQSVVVAMTQIYAAISVEREVTFLVIVLTPCLATEDPPVHQVVLEAREAVVAGGPLAGVGAEVEAGVVVEAGVGVGADGQGAEGAVVEVVVNL